MVTARMNALVNSEPANDHEKEQYRTFTHRMLEASFQNLRT